MMPDPQQRPRSLVRVAVRVLGFVLVLIGAAVALLPLVIIGDPAPGGPRGSSVHLVVGPLAAVIGLLLAFPTRWRRAGKPEDVSNRGDR